MNGVKIQNIKRGGIEMKLSGGIGIILFVAVFLISGCGETRQTRRVQQTGFLGDYSFLRKGGKGEPLYIYKNPSVNWASYKKVWLDRVTYWRGPDSKREKISQADLRRFLNNFHNLLFDNLALDYQIVDKPGPGTLHIQVAVTKIEKSWVVLDAASTVVPLSRAASTVKEVITGKPAFVGEMSIEGKITDAQTGKLLAAAVDRRAGRKKLSSFEFKSWNDVDEAMKFWATQLRYRLCGWRRGSNCVPPKNQ
jgi:hypothetical protein